HLRTTSAEIERNDSGVGTETSKPSRLRRLMAVENQERQCADCDQQVEPREGKLSGMLCDPLVCRKCERKRYERKELITEIVVTEVKYGRDLNIVKEEFYRPMEVAGLLGKEQLRQIFLNIDELISFSAKFAEKLKDAIDIAREQGDEDYTTVNIGKLFLESTDMLHAFETYCVQQ
ncbi:T-lymphoma invasion and metastasis-inducing protein 1-like, partial [Limulus polyphemus]|uniref:T-lymphoma invasion and metastasis-inducing protein 1-like n=1 Tax=Limulus polyphemus TaxID=6850 RepID=A0ABM1C3B2_LIMPO